MRQSAHRLSRPGKTQTLRRVLDRRPTPRDNPADARRRTSPLRPPEATRLGPGTCAGPGPGAVRPRRDGGGGSSVGLFD